MEIVHKNVADLNTFLQNAVDDNLQHDLQVKFILIPNRYQYQYLSSLQHFGRLYHSAILIITYGKLNILFPRSRLIRKKQRWQHASMLQTTPQHRAQKRNS